MIRTMLLVLGCCLMATSYAQAADWILSPSTYTHDPATGRRVTQFAPIPDVYVANDSSYVKSGYRYTQSNRRGPNGRAGERLHIVEEWGREVRPYEEWQYPYRPYSVPYQAWGPPYGGLTPFFGPGVPSADRPRPGHADDDHLPHDDHHGVGHNHDANHTHDANHNHNDPYLGRGAFGGGGYYYPYPPAPPYPAYLGRP